MAKLNPVELRLKLNIEVERSGQKRFVRFREGDPVREESRAKELELARAMKVLAEHHFGPDGKPKNDDWCSCVDHVLDLVAMIEELHKRIDVLDPDSIRPDVKDEEQTDGQDDSRGSPGPEGEGSSTPS